MERLLTSMGNLMGNLITELLKDGNVKRIATGKIDQEVSIKSKIKGGVR